jgi:hypothetical protein
VQVDRSAAEKLHHALSRRLLAGDVQDSLAGGPCCTPSIPFNLNTVTKLHLRG